MVQERSSDSPDSTAAVTANMAATASPRAQFGRGIKSGIPIFLGYIPVGAAFGILAKTAGFTIWQSALNSATALAGAGQFIGLAVTQTSGVAAALAATAVVNLRYILFSTTMSPYVKGVKQPLLAWLAFTMTDETFAINIAEHRAGVATPLSMAGVGFVSFAGWVLGTALGAVGAGWIGDPSRWGVDFAMPAMFAALFVALAEDRRHVMIGMLAGVLALVVPLLTYVGVSIDPSWSIIIASVTAATIASVAFK